MFLLYHLSIVLAICIGEYSAQSNSTAIRCIEYFSTGIKGSFGNHLVIGNRAPAITNIPLANASCNGNDNPLNFSGNTKTSPSSHILSKVPI